MVNQKQIDDLVEKIVRHYRPRQIMLFGSYASGTANESSDLDILVVKSTTLPKYKRGAEVRKIIRSDGKRYLFPMDILVYTPDEVEKYKNDPYSLIHEILATGKVLYESKQPKRLVN